VNVQKLVTGLVAMGCLTALEMTALITGLDGQLFTVVIAAIAGIGGYTIADKTESPKEAK